MLSKGSSQVHASTERWDTLAEEFPNDARLQRTVVYSLPVKLLDILQNHVPTLLTEDDQKFERRLRELAGTGFRHQLAFGCELLDPPNSGEISAELFGDVRVQLKREIQLRMHDVLAPASNSESANLAGKRERLRNRFDERLQGFAGWLVTNPVFRGEVSFLEEQWDQWPRLVSNPPDRDILDRALPSGMTGLELKQMSELFAAARNFLDRWCLARMDTWDLPIPVPPVQLTNDPVPTNDLHSTGVSLFIPWSLLADRDLKVEEILEYHRSRQDLSHLDGWTCSGRINSWGVERHAKLLTVFVYLELAIKQRYPNRLRGNLRKLDAAFRVFWGPPPADDEALIAGAETARKIREELKRRLATIP